MDIAMDQNYHRLTVSFFLFSPNLKKKSLSFSGHVLPTRSQHYDVIGYFEGLSVMPDCPDGIQETLGTRFRTRSYYSLCTVLRFNYATLFGSNKSMLESLIVFVRAAYMLLCFLVTVNF